MSQRRPGIVTNFLIRAIVGMVLIFFVNEFLAYRGIDVKVGLNVISFIISGILGVPGVALLYGIIFYQVL